MKKFIKRIIIVLIFPLLLTIGMISFFLELPIWLFTGKGIMNNVCDGMALSVIKFLNN